jgi:hypothetical protein
MKRYLRIAGLLLVGLGLLACKGTVYLTFDWTYAPDLFATDDYNLPATIYRGDQYKTDPGDYYFTTYWWDGMSGYWYYTLHYTLSAHSGLFPDDAVFEIYCWYDDFPSILQLQGLAPPSGGADSISRATALPEGKKEILYTGAYKPPRGSAIEGRIEIGHIVPE